MALLSAALFFSSFSASAYPPILDEHETVTSPPLSEEDFLKFVRFSLLKSEIGPDTPNRHYSPSKTAWYETGISPCPYNDAPYVIHLFPVAQHLLEIKLSHTEACHYQSRFRWESDQELTLFIWLGRVGAIQFTYDLTSQKVTHKSRHYIESAR